MLGPWEVALLGGVALLEEVCHCAESICEQSRMLLGIFFFPAVFL